MENKINVAELLKNCPKGMELDCSIWDNVVFDHIDTTSNYPIYIKKMEGELEYLTEDGHFNFDCDAKCVIFPKGKTTWEGFVPPCKFKDGDVVATTNGLFVGIVEVKNNKPVGAYCSIDYAKDFRINNDYVFDRLATEEEKKKLFNAIKENGYKWNEETKTLEKLVEPKFKVGDMIQDVDKYKVKITEVNIEDECYGYESMIAKGIGGIPFKEQNNWELVPNKFDINTLKPFDKVLVRCSSLEKWHIQFFEKYNTELGAKYPFICLCNSKYCQCIPYEGNEHLLNTANDCDNFYKIW